MSLPLLAILVLTVLVLGYTIYGRLIARQYRLDDATRCPSEEVNDGVDFVPTRPFYLLGQHFSAIAAAGPIVGPIAACLAFGWLPCILWIAFGVVFIGAVHDFSSLVASVRHKAKSIAEIVRVNLGRRAWLAILCFIWIALVYVIVAFADVTAASFKGNIEDMATMTVSFDKGGAVAFASTAYLLLAILMGLIQKRWNPPLWLMTAVFVPATLGVVWLGTKVSTLLMFSHTTWVWGIMVYCLIASLLPVWLLLQPRGYLGGFVLYMALAIGVVGIFFGGFKIEQPAFKGWTDPATGDTLLPFLFVTIACGACSGFHGLVCSGTTSKQITKESHCKAVGYGAMLLEGFVALIALATVLIVTPKAGSAAGAIYGEGMGRFLTVLIGPEHQLFATVFGTMVFSTFVFDTLDVATRLGRYILQELTNATGRAGAVLSTLVMAAVPLVLLLAAGPGSWKKYWTLFGTSNQLLAALTLLAITVWLRNQKRPYWFTLAPMVFVMGITVWSLAIQAANAFRQPVGFRPETINGVVSILLAGLSAFLAFEAARRVTRPTPVPG